MLSLCCSEKVLTSSLIARVEDQNAQVTLHFSTQPSPQTTDRDLICCFCYIRAT
jgi:hypothetical protein